MANENIQAIQIEDELRKSYLDYAMSTIISRSLPDARDGLKPVHRRILYAMWKNDYKSNKPTKKSARIVGDVMGVFHPHGDSAIYDSLVRMAQEWSMRVPLIDGQGNFGNIDGDPPAAMRYTEARLTSVSDSLLDDLDCDTVAFSPNYDDTTVEPDVLPARFPNVLVNGSGGIAVGMATNIPTHNLTEVIDATLALLKDPDASLKTLMKFLAGPDFPTGGCIVNAADLERIYQTGRGSVVMRGTMEVEEIRRGRKALVISEIPYQIKKSTLVEKIADLIKSKKIDGITDVRDESDREGIRIVLELRPAVIIQRIADQIYKDTPLETSFGVNMLALRDGRPEMLGLKEVLEAFLAFRREVVTKRAAYQLAKAQARSHVVLGYCIATGDLDHVVKLIRQSATPAEARQALMDATWSVLHLPVRIDAIDPTMAEIQPGRVQLTEIQAQAILDLRLHRLTSLERQELTDELTTLAQEITTLQNLVTNRGGQVDAVIAAELKDLRKRYGTPRRTQIGASGPLVT